MSLQERLILRRLKKEDIHLNVEELREVINIYNHLLDLYFEKMEHGFGYRFEFAVLPRSLYLSMDEYCLQIFKNIIELKKNNLLRYLDYSLLLDNDEGIWISSSDILWELRKVLNNIIDSYESYGDNFIYIKMKKNRDFILVFLVNGGCSSVIESKFIPQDYKDIIQLYDEIYACNISEYKYMDIYKWNYFTFIAMTYYYFLMNDSFNKEPNKVLDFLDNIYNSIQDTIDRINTNGIENNEDMINYIDSLYKNVNKEKIMK